MTAAMIYLFKQWQIYGLWLFLTVVNKTTKNRADEVIFLSTFGQYFFKLVKLVSKTADYHKQSYKKNFFVFLGPGLRDSTL
jgi:hypothetical protein